VSGADDVIGGGAGMDYLSDVSGNRVVFARVTPEESAIYTYDLSSGAAPADVAPDASPSNRHAPAIGGQTVAWQLN
jgi:hypothetical protein